MLVVFLTRYVPPLLWGKSGHLQTIVYGRLGRVKTPFTRGERVYVSMSDGGTVTYDVFEPLRQHPHGRYLLASFKQPDRMPECVERPSPVLGSNPARVKPMTLKLILALSNEAYGIIKIGQGLGGLVSG